MNTTIFDTKELKEYYNRTYNTGIPKYLAEIELFLQEVQEKAYAAGYQDGRDDIVIGGGSNG